MKRALKVGAMMIGLGLAKLSVASGWPEHAVSSWERALLQSTVLEVYGQRYHLLQQPSRRLLRDFLDEQAPEWVKQAHQQVLPTGLLLSGQTARVRWLLKVSAVSGGTHWSWAGQALPARRGRGATRPGWLPAEGVVMFASQASQEGSLITQQSYRFNMSLTTLQQRLGTRLEIQGWRREQADSVHERWAKPGAELDLLYHRLAGQSSLYLILRESTTSVP